VALESCAKLVHIGSKWIEVDRNRPVRRHDIAHASQGRLMNRLGERNGFPVDYGIDPIGELHDQRGIASRHNPEAVHTSARRSF
jgi:hypothetical protein